MTLFKNFVLSCIVTVLGACAVQPKTYDEGVWYTYATAEVVVDAAVAVATDPATPADVAAKVKQALLDARPYFVKLHDADVAVDAAKDAVAAGTGTQEKLEIALSMLQAAEAAAGNPIKAVATAAAGGK